MRVQTKIVGALLLVLGLSGCASSSNDDYGYSEPPPAPSPMVASNSLPRTTGTSRVESKPGQTPLQCVPYAREHSQIKIFGDAWTWWDQASGKYERGSAPATGTVLVLHNYAGPNHGHVAVVKRIVSSREIRIDHANWLNDGSIYVNNPVVDVSAGNDWSAVRVFNIQTGAWGGKTYPVQGFIGSGSNRASVEAPRSPAPRPEVEDDAPEDALPIDDLIAELSSAPPKPVRTAAARSVPVSTAKVQPAALTAADRNPPAGSPFALTAEDLADPEDR